MLLLASQSSQTSKMNQSTNPKGGISVKQVMSFLTRNLFLLGLQADLARVRGELESSEVELNRLLQEKMERRNSLVAKVSTPR